MALEASDDELIRADGPAVARHSPTIQAVQVDVGRGLSDSLRQGAHNGNVATQSTMSARARGKQRAIDVDDDGDRRGPSANERISDDSEQTGDRSSDDVTTSRNSRQSSSSPPLKITKRKLVVSSSSSSSAESVVLVKTKREQRSAKKKRLKRVPHSFTLIVPIKRSASVKLEHEVRRDPPPVIASTHSIAGSKIDTEPDHPAIPERLRTAESLGSSETSQPTKGTTTEFAAAPEAIVNGSPTDVDVMSNAQSLSIASDSPSPSLATKTNAVPDNAVNRAMSSMQKPQGTSRSGSLLGTTKSTDRSTPDDMQQQADGTENPSCPVDKTAAEPPTSIPTTDNPIDEAGAKKTALEAHIDKIMENRRLQLAAMASAKQQSSTAQVVRASSVGHSPTSRQSVLIEIGSAKNRRPDTSVQHRAKSQHASDAGPNRMSANLIKAASLPNVLAPTSVRPDRRLESKQAGRGVLFDREPPKPPALPIGKILNDDYEPARRAGGWICSFVPAANRVRTTSVERRGVDSDDEVYEDNDTTSTTWTWSISKALEAAAKTAGEAVRRTNRMFTQSKLPCDVASATAADSTTKQDLKPKRARRRDKRTTRQILNEQYLFLKDLAESSDEGDDGDGVDRGPLAMVRAAFSFDERFGDETICQDLVGTDEDDEDASDVSGGLPGGIVGWQLEGLDRGRGRAWNAAIGVSRQGGPNGRSWAVADPTELAPTSVIDLAESSSDVEVDDQARPWQPNSTIALLQLSAGPTRSSSPPL
ncbi:hypothetical protein OIV83_003931 [Microbotryomycetes sp. JL201]|nr:hypothetical protein OIV83_003931 [Microbotryomycetes sp. JL201]